jgi:hypothetical protein
VALDLWIRSGSAERHAICAVLTQDDQADSVVLPFSPRDFRYWRANQDTLATFVIFYN